MAGGTRSFAFPAGGESSGSEDDDGWDIGCESKSPLAADLALDECKFLEHLLQQDVIAQHLGEILPTHDKVEAFKKALTTGNLPVIEELLNSGISVESTFKFGWTALMYAASVVNVELMRILLDRGANASFDKDQYTVLMAACIARASEEQILKCVELLLSRNANPNVACRKKITPLMYAAREGHSQVVALLVAHGSQVNAQDENGYTALTWAARQGHKKVIFKLLELGADKSIQTKDGQTPGEVAKNNRHSELFSLLSLTAHPFQGRFQNLSKEDAICRLQQTVPETARNHTASSYMAFGDLEVFLHSLGLEHVSEVLKETETTLRQLLTMGIEDLIQIGIKDTRDQEKILDAVKELHVEEVKLDELPKVTNIEFSGDEFLTFLVKLNRQCGHLTAAVQSVVNQFPTDFHKLVLEWNPPQSLNKVCEDLVSSADSLNGEVSRLKELIKKLQDGRNSDPCQIQPLEKKGRWSKTFLKMAAVTLVGSGCVFLVTKVTLRKS